MNEPMERMLASQRPYWPDNLQQAQHQLLVALQYLVITAAGSAASEQYHPSSDVDSSDDRIRQGLEDMAGWRELRLQAERLITGVIESPRQRKLLSALEQAAERIEGIERHKGKLFGLVIELGKLLSQGPWPRERDEQERELLQRIRDTYTEQEVPF